MTIGVIATSSRQGAYSLKVANILADYLQSGGSESFLVDLHSLVLPLLGHDLSQKTSKELDDVRQKLQTASGFVVVTPEWNGTAAPGWNNLMLYVGDSLAHKPIMAVGVSAGRGGAYPLLAIRSSGYKNSRYVIIPESLIISHCQEAITEDGSLTDHPAAEILGDRADYALGVLKAYAEALDKVRGGLAIDHKRYPSGV